MTLVKLTGKNSCEVLVNPELVCCIDVLPNHQGCVLSFNGVNVQVRNPVDEVVALLGAKVVKTR